MTEYSRCVTCGATAQEFCHIDGNYDDAYELGSDHGYKQGFSSARSQITRLLESMKGDENGEGAWPISEALIEIDKLFEEGAHNA